MSPLSFLLPGGTAGWRRDGLDVGLDVGLALWVVGLMPYRSAPATLVSRVGRLLVLLSWPLWSGASGAEGELHQRLRQ